MVKEALRQAKSSVSAGKIHGEAMDSLCRPRASTHGMTLVSRNLRDLAKLRPGLLDPGPSAEPSYSAASATGSGLVHFSTG
jgi:hypothetical protein